MTYDEDVRLEIALHILLGTFEEIPFCGVARQHSPKWHVKKGQGGCYSIDDDEMLLRWLQHDQWR